MLCDFTHRASRGLGLGLASELSATKSNLVIATCRNPSSASELNSLRAQGRDNLHIVQLDVSDEASIRASVAAVERVLAGRGLDVLYNNAGIVRFVFEMRCLRLKQAPLIVRTRAVGSLGRCFRGRVRSHYVRLEDERRRACAPRQGLSSVARAWHAKDDCEH